MGWFGFGNKPDPLQDAALAALARKEQQEQLWLEQLNAEKQDLGILAERIKALTRENEKLKTVESENQKLKQELSRFQQIKQTAMPETAPAVPPTSFFAHISKLPPANEVKSNPASKPAPALDPAPKSVPASKAALAGAALAGAALAGESKPTLAFKPAPASAPTSKATPANESKTIIDSKAATASDSKPVPAPKSAPASNPTPKPAPVSKPAPASNPTRETAPASKSAPASNPTPEPAPASKSAPASNPTPEPARASKAAPALTPDPAPVPVEATGGSGIPTGDATKGAKLFKAKCAQCHTCEPGGSSKQGPALHGIIGRPAGSIGYDFTSAVKDSKIVWNDEHLFKFMLAPKKYVPGTKMVFAGLKKEAERADIIAYIGKQSE